PPHEGVRGRVEVWHIRLAETRDAKLLHRVEEVLAVQIVELDPRPLALAHLVHRRLVARPPAVGEGMPILVVTLWPKKALRLAGNAVAPVHHSAEHIESQGLYVRERHLLNSLPGYTIGRPMSRVGGGA